MRSYSALPLVVALTVVWLVVATV